MIERFIPKIEDYYILATPAKNKKMTELIGLRLPKEYTAKLEKAALVEKREPITILRAIVLQALDKIDI